MKKRDGFALVLATLGFLWIIMLFFELTFIRGCENFFSRADLAPLLDIDNPNPGGSNRIDGSEEIFQISEAPEQREFVTNMKEAVIGSYILFGEYEQDNNTSNGKEDIEWLVLDKQEDKLLVISWYGLDCQPYNAENENVTWEKSSLREWLNSTFYETAFTSEDKSLILDSVVTADANPEHDTPAGNDTTDKVFLLSIDEVGRYLVDDDARTCRGTRYCYAQGTPKDDLGDCRWWLRSPGTNSFCAADVSRNSYVNYSGVSVFIAENAVRPAMWINLAP